MVHEMPAFGYNRKAAVLVSAPYLFFLFNALPVIFFSTISFIYALHFCVSFFFRFNGVCTMNMNRCRETFFVYEMFDF